jgi:ubiquinone/menaquinone biosynthesis C-methylase UbiE
LSKLLADAFDADVRGVEPSARMREVAARENPHRRVRYLEGSGEQIPLADGTCDAALLSYVIHHLDDRDASAVEMRRVVRPGGLVLLRSTLRESLEHLPHWEFFPAARQIAESRMPPRGEVVALFRASGFEQVASEVVKQETAPSLRAYHERMKLRAISTLELLDDAEFEEGIARLRHAAEGETDPRPVMEDVDLLVFRRP